MAERSRALPTILATPYALRYTKTLRRCAVRHLAVYFERLATVGIEVLKTLYADSTWLMIFSSQSLIV